MKKRLLEILGKILGINKVEVQDDGNLSINEDQHAELKNKLGEEDYNKLIELIGSVDLLQEQQEAINELRATMKIIPEDGKDDEDDPKLGKQSNAAEERKNNEISFAELSKQVQDELTANRETIKKLQEKAENDDPKKIKGEGKVIPIDSRVSSETHLFSIDHEMFDLNKPWNKLAIDKQPIGNAWKRHEKTFVKEFEEYSSSLRDRINQLQDEGRLGEINMTDLDFDGFDSTGWGQEYVVRRQDAIIAYIKTLPSVSAVFPVVYGVQNKQVMTNAFLSEFSRSYKSGELTKGDVTLQPEEAQVYDVMHKHKFTNLKNLEKEYIGYLNREGSSPIKWSFVEWLMVNILKQLQNEWNERRILGYRIEPTDTDADHHRFGSDGVLRRLDKYVEDYKLSRFTDYNNYTSSTILTVVENFVAAVAAIVPSLDGYALYMNEKHIPWYKAKYRDSYGTDIDFRGAKLTVMDYDLPIIGVPNMGKSCQLFITMPNNIELYENAAGEMADIYFERRLEDLWTASYWKEGAGAYLSGKKFTSAALCLANNHKDEYIFLSDPYVELADEATTLDASKGYKYKSVANSSTKNITDITSAEYGIVYRFELGSATNPQTINKTGNFSEIDSTFTPTAVGDYIEVYKRESDDKFIEVRRQVT